MKCNCDICKHSSMLSFLCAIYYYFRTSYDVWIRIKCLFMSHVQFIPTQHLSSKFLTIEETNKKKTSQQPSFHMTTQIDLNMCISSPNTGLDSKDRVCDVPEVYLCAIVSNAWNI